jgi:putative ABC transport system substrate-binding protein
VNNRRKLIIALGACALAAPFASYAQQEGKIWRVGVLVPRGRPASLESDVFGGFPQGMRELGYVEGKNLVIEWRFGDGKYERLPGLAAELATLKVDAIVTGGPQATSAAQKATATIPIVMGSVPDPVERGFIVSLARPAGNITGLSNLAVDIGPKYLEILLSFVPKLSHVAVLVNPDNLGLDALLKRIDAVKTNVTILRVKARTPQEIDNAFAVMVRERIGAVIVPQDSFFNQQERQIVGLAAKGRLPLVAAPRSYVDAGGLVSYGPNLTDQWRRAATYVNKILKGAKPSDLPVEQPTKFEMFINGKTAKTLGLKIPQSLLIMADKIIE